MEINKVSVKIYGQEYTVAGEKSENEIKELANYVDDKMRSISKLAGDPALGNVAVLTAMVMAEEFFDGQEEKQKLEKLKAQMENDAKYYLKMWEDSKKSFAQYKDSLLEMKNKKKAEDDKVKELEQKCREYESTCFDLQMENIRLKSALEKSQK